MSCLADKKEEKESKRRTFKFKEQNRMMLTFLAKMPFFQSNYPVVIVYKNNIPKKNKKGNDNKTPEVPAACLITVPKDSYIDRICCPEPVTFV